MSGANTLCYEANIEESEKGSTYRGLWGVGGCPAVVAQLQRTCGSSQRCPGFDSWRLPPFSLASILTRLFSGGAWG